MRRRVHPFFAPAGLASSGGIDQIQVAGAISLGGTALNSTVAGTLRS